MKGNSILYLPLLLLTVVAGCATPSIRFKDLSDELFIGLRGSEAAALFPVEYRDIYVTLHRADDYLSKEKIEAADMYYQLAIGKIDLLEKNYTAEVRRRAEEARLEREKREREAAEELRKKQEIEREQAEKAAEAAALARKIEEEKAEARRRAERKTEVALVSSHTVKRGETLPQIAARPEVYGDSSLWPLLYRANRDQISNPKVLWPGQVLRIPRNYDRSDLNEARKYSSERQLR